MKIIDGIPVCGDPVDGGALRQIKKAKEFCEYAALMADHHQGYGVPIGGVIASQDMISPTAVGYDIGCGNMAVRLDMDALEITERMGAIMDEVVKKVSFGIGRVSDWDVQAELFDDPLWDTLDCLRKTPKNPSKPLIQSARAQLGTVGSGNHYVDIFEEAENGYVWVGVHFGSRGLGHTIASWFLKALNADDHDLFADPVMVDQFSDLGAQYLLAMELAGRYAYAGRIAVVEKVVEILGSPGVTEMIHNHHNYAWREIHGGVHYWVMRKGATPAFPGQRGFVGGSMGDDSVILEGVESEDSKALFYSTVHGAGRVMSRTAATGRSRWGKVKGEGAISKESMHQWLRQKGVELRGADTDEAPQAYKRLHEVLPQQGPTIRILHTLKPLGVAMAGSDTFDPWKD